MYHNNAKFTSPALIVVYDRNIYITYIVTQRDGFDKAIAWICSIHGLVFLAEAHFSVT